MAQKHRHLEKKTLNVYKLLKRGSGARGEIQRDSTRVKWRSLESGEWTTLSGARHQATSSQLDRSCPKTWLSVEDCTRREDGRKTDTRKTKKKDVGPTHGARGQEDRLPCRSWREELNTGSSGTIIIWTCLRAEHTRDLPPSLSMRVTTPYYRIVFLLAETDLVKSSRDEMS